jgi:hypothetical protein
MERKTQRTSKGLIQTKTSGYKPEVFYCNKLKRFGYFINRLNGNIQIFVG